MHKGIEKINGIYVNWDKSKVIKHGPARGKHYATYYDRECTKFHFWLKRQEVLSSKYIKEL